jgi:hypothetical protein
LLALAISSCQSLAPTATPTVDQDIDLDDLSQEETATAAAATGQAPSQGPGGVCDNPYVTVVEGATWRSEITFGTVSFTQTDTITDVGSDAFLVETSAAGTSVVTTWTCTEDGILWLQSNGGMFSAVTQDATWTTDSYSGVTIPKDIQPGDTWTSSQQLTATDANGSSSSFTINIDYQAIGIESVTVPAGTFNAMRIDFVMTFSGSGDTDVFEFSNWFVENVGLVKTVAQQTEGGSLSFTQDLSSYSIP